MNRRLTRAAKTAILLATAAALVWAACAGVATNPHP